MTVPILSIGKLTDDDNDVLLQKRGGKIIHLPTGETMAVEKRYGVYWIILEMDEHVLQPKDLLEDQDFHGPGAP